MGTDPIERQRRQRPGKAQRAAARQEASPLPLKQAQAPQDGPTTTQVTRYQRTYYPDVIVAELIALIVDRNDGVVKICPTDDWKVCYWYWRWSRGPYSGYYVCVMTDVHSVGEAVTLLREKRDQVEAGLRKPTRDKFA